MFGGQTRVDNSVDRFLDVRQLQLTLPVRQLFQQINTGSLAGSSVAGRCGCGFHDWTLNAIANAFADVSTIPARAELSKTPPPTAQERVRRAVSANLHHREFALRRAARRAYPGIRYVGPARAGRYALVGTSGGLIVDMTAKKALPLSKILAHVESHASGRPYTVPLTPDRMQIFAPGVK